MFRNANIFSILETDLRRRGGWQSARQALRQGKIPFEIYDPFYSTKNQAELYSRIADIEAGKNLSTHELIEV